MEQAFSPASADNNIQPITSLFVFGDTHDVLDLLSITKVSEFELGTLLTFKEFLSQ